MSDGGIESKFLMSIDISFEPPVVATPGLVVINVTGGSFEGPQLKGDMIGPGGDWARVQDNGNWKIDARLAMRTDDGETIYCYYGGVVRMTEELAARSAAGRCSLMPICICALRPISKPAPRNMAGLTILWRWVK